MDAEIELKPHSGHPVIYATVQDISEQKRAEKRLIEYSERLEEMVAERTQALRDAQERLLRQERLAALGQLAGGVGHELRNPLGVITNAIYYLKKVQLDVSQKVAEYLDLIDNNAQDAARIVSDLLDFARVKPADRVSVSIDEFVKPVISKQPPPDGIQLVVDIPSDLAPVYVDALQIQQVISNLVSNAYQAMPAGGVVTVSAEQVLGDEKELDADNQIKITIADNGSGIPPENLEKIFEPLFTTRTSGIGLGLAISKSLVQVNGGQIEVKSQVGESSVFTLKLPVCEKAS